ncbi:MAG: CPBP family intramembrane metalloprotease [Pseudomonadales bacterium]|nr:CPBP family intramembrane metalloprotease [Pseudomonadales bacterium]
MDRRLKIFFCLTFAISWGVPLLFLVLAPSIGHSRINLMMYSMLYYVGVWGPAVAAFITIAWVDGEDGLINFWRRIIAWRTPRRWYVAALVGIPLIYIMAASIAWMLGGEAFSWPSSFGAWGMVILMALGRLIAGPMEEIGWRGYALPLLQQQFSGLGAAVVLGFIWGVWHLPLFLNGMGHSLVAFIAQIVAVSIIFTVLFNASRGCIPLMILCHWLTNFPYPWEGDADLMPAQSFMLVLAAALACIVFGKRYLGRENLYNRTPGSGDDPDLDLVGVERQVVS